MENPNFKWPITLDRRIHAPAEKVWETISSPGNLSYCHPFCEKNPVEQWPGVGSKDAVHYYNGMVLHREFFRWIVGIGYDLKIGGAKNKPSRVSWRIQSESPTHSTLTISICAHILQHVPVFIRWLPHYLYLHPMLRSYLNSVLKGFEFYITTGQPVKRNQWGSHHYFSSRKR